jgi:RNA polymerase sigma factor (sigma-70 family)
MKPIAVRNQIGLSQQEFEDLFSKYRGLVYRAAYTVTGSRLDAEDALQKLFLKLLDQAFSDKFIRNPEGYLYRAAVNEALQIKRARTRWDHTDDDVEVLKDLRTERNAGRDDMRHRLLDAMAKLDPEHAEILLLCYDHGYSDRQIADMLGRTRAAVAMTMHRARERLKEMMSEDSRERETP